MKYAWICVNAPVNVRNRRGRKKMKFCNEVNVCLTRFGNEKRVLLIGDMNGIVGSNEMLEWWGSVAFKE